VRVTRAYEEFVAPGNFTFQPRDNADRLGNVVKFTWEMVPSDGGAAAGAGLEILVLDEDGRIKTDYQFIEPSHPSPDPHVPSGTGRATRSTRHALARWAAQRDKQNTRRTPRLQRMGL